jgi:anti-sigma regulatory factor (Ser/Thr protein kinase)
MSFDHDAFVYGSDTELLAGLGPYVRAGLQADETVVAVLPRRNAELLAAHLGPDVTAVELIDADDWYQKPEATIAGYDRMLNGLGGRRGRVIGEVSFGHDPDSWADWTRYEAALNEAFRQHDAHVVCPYDRRSLPATVIEAARHTHPMVWTSTDRTPSGDFRDPRHVAAEHARAIPVPPTLPDLVVDLDGHLRDARGEFADALRAAGITGQRADELALAVNEIVTNAIVHGGDHGELRVWSGADRLVCAVSERGPGVDDPLAGFVPPDLTATRGRGLWMARQLFDRVELEQSSDGFTVWLATEPTAG